MAVFDPITKDEQLGIAEQTLKRIKAICPRFSLPADKSERADLIQIWAEALFADYVWPRTVYKKAIVIYATTATREDNPPTPGDMIRFCIQAVDRMESDPVEGPRLQRWRDERMALITGRELPPWP